MDGTLATRTIVMYNKYGQAVQVTGALGGGTQVRQLGVQAGKAKQPFLVPRLKVEVSIKAVRSQPRTKIRFRGYNRG